MIQTERGEEIVRIGVIGRIGPDLFTDNIVSTLTDMGHIAVPLGSLNPSPGRFFSRVGSVIRDALPTVDEHIQRKVMIAAIKAECDIVINVDQQLMPGIVRGLHHSAIKVAMWFPDPVVHIRRQLMLLTPYDAVFFKEPHIVDRVQALLEKPVFYLPEACNPQCHRPLVTPGTDPHLVIAGNMYPTRIQLLERLLACGIPLKIYGAGFPRWIGETSLRAVHAGYPVFREEKARVFRSAAAVLNTMNPGEIFGVNARLFEAAGCGAAVLTEFRPTLPDLFAIGDEVLAFRDFNELVMQAKRLLSEGGLSAKLGDAAAARAHESHTYQQRLTVILEKLC